MATPRRFSGSRLVIASHNAGKVAEIDALLAPFGVAAVAAGDLGLDEPEETGASFIENAEIKARAAAQATNLPALADDSGLAVRALKGAPGIWSARWAGADKNFAAAMQTIEDRLRAEGSGDRRARFICALALCWPDGHCETFEGEVNGVLVWPPRGTRGFGYDPVFQPDDAPSGSGDPLSFGEMEPDDKHEISHRADAFRQLVAACFERP